MPGRLAPELDGERTDGGHPERGPRFAGVHPVRTRPRPARPAHPRRPARRRPGGGPGRPGSGPAWCPRTSRHRGRPRGPRPAGAPRGHPTPRPASGDRGRRPQQRHALDRPRERHPPAVAAPSGIAMVRKVHDTPSCRSTVRDRLGHASGVVRGHEPVDDGQRQRIGPLRGRGARLERDVDRPEVARRVGDHEQQVDLAVRPAGTPGAPESGTARNRRKSAESSTRRRERVRRLRLAEQRRQEEQRAAGPREAVERRPGAKARRRAARADRARAGTRADCARRAAPPRAARA